MTPIEDALVERWVLDGHVVDRDDLDADPVLRRSVTAAAGLSATWWCRVHGPSVSRVARAVAERGALWSEGSVADEAGVTAAVRACDDGSSPPALVQVQLLPGRALTGPPRLDHADLVVSVDPDPVGDVGSWTVAVAPWVRTTGPGAGVVSPDDAEVHVGRRHAASVGVDAVAWVDGAGEVVSVDTSVVVAELDGRLVTPPPGRGAPWSAWAAAARDGLDLVEAPLTPDDLVRADGLAAIGPRGSVAWVSMAVPADEGAGVAGPVGGEPSPLLAELAAMASDWLEGR